MRFHNLCFVGFNEFTELSVYEQEQAAIVEENEQKKGRETDGRTDRQTYRSFVKDERMSRTFSVEESASVASSCC